MYIGALRMWVDKDNGNLNEKNGMRSLRDCAVKEFRLYKKPPTAA